MSTNYFAHTTNTPTDNGLHIGKRSAGWNFLFRAHFDQELDSQETWEEYLNQPGVHITDEYGYPHTPDEFWGMVAHTQASGRTPMSCGHYRDPQGYNFCDQEFC